ncbi:MAG: AsmA family protein, partial [Pseudomonadota bacterium]
MNTFILSIGAILIAILVALFAIPPFIDWNTYRGIFEEEASRILGRDVRVGGDVNLRFLPSPYIRFERVTIASEDGVVGEPFLRAESFTMQLAAPPLLSGVVEARKIAIEGAKLRLRLDKNGRGNWQRLNVGRGSLAVTPREIALQQVALSDAEVTLEGAEGRLIGRLGAISGDLAAPTMSGPFRFSGTAQLAGRDRRVSFTASRWNAGEQTSQIRLGLRGADDADNLKLIGVLTAGPDAPPSFNGSMTATFDLNGAVASDRGATTRGDGARQMVEAQAELTFDTRVMQLSNLAVSLANSVRPQTLTGGATVQLSDTPRVDASLSSRWLDVDAFLPPSSNAGADGMPWARTANRLIERASALVQGDVMAGAVRLQVERAMLGGQALGRVDADLSFAPQRLGIERFVAIAPGGTTLQIDGTVTPTAANPGTAAQGATAAPRAAEFAGHIVAEGANVARFARWIIPDDAVAAFRRPQPFALRTSLLLARTRVGLRDLRVTVGTSDLAGRVAADLSDGGQIAVSLTGRRVDLRLLKQKFDVAQTLADVLADRSDRSDTSAA